MPAGLIEILHSIFLKEGKEALFGAAFLPFQVFIPSTFQTSNFETDLKEDLA